jgi:hypothetical protein
MVDHTRDVVGRAREPFFVRGPRLWGRVSGFAYLGFLVATIIRGGNHEWGWMTVLAIPVIPLGWLTLRLLDERFD